MNSYHPLWFLCIFIRSLVIKSIMIFKNTVFKNYLALFILSMGFGFLYKSCHGSNNEFQIEKVYWHHTRLFHATLHILSALNLLGGNNQLAIFCLVIDIGFSFVYVTTKKY